MIHVPMKQWWVKHPPPAIQMIATCYAVPHWLSHLLRHCSSRGVCLPRIFARLRSCELLVGLALAAATSILYAEPSSLKSWQLALETDSVLTDKAVLEYKRMLEDENPADLYLLKGQALWNLAKGPQAIPLSDPQRGCDLGLGPGVVRGAWAELPRYFSDTKLVQDLESRLLSCLQRLQGLDAQQIISSDFNQTERVNISLMALYIASESKGSVFRVPQSTQTERDMYLLGKRLFFLRAGTHDFSCASCHAQDGRRIRLQELPNLTMPKGAGFAYGTWPAYRISSGSIWGMQQRLADCFRQQRLAKPLYVSNATIALMVYMAVNANGQPANAPGLKR